ncbi:MAG: proline iminopeptidase-family hydrolase [Thermoleophilia bacterium]|nr:proline iminopeptidase-family hydrolase [Thermoleophilia bacterium]
MTEGYAGFDDHRTWYRVVGDLEAGGPAPLVVLHGGPGAVHDYLLPLGDLAQDGRAVVFYDQLGSGNSTHLPERGAEFWTVELFVRELANLLDHLGIAERYHVLGQSWGGFLAQEHALTHPPGLLALVLSNTAASFPDFVSEANRLRAGLPPDVEATLRRHEAAGTTDDPEYEEACIVFYKRHLCRLPEWPEEVDRTFAKLAEDPTVYHTMNGPSEFHVIGSIRDWQSTDRLSQIDVPTLVISGRYDEATPALQEPLVARIPQTEQVILEESSHLPMWEEREAYLAAVGDWLRRHD